MYERVVQRGREPGQLANKANRPALFRNMCEFFGVGQSVNLFLDYYKTLVKINLNFKYILNSLLLNKNNSTNLNK